MSRYSLVEGSIINPDILDKFKGKISPLLKLKIRDGTNYFALKDGLPVGCIEVGLVFIDGISTAFIYNLYVDIMDKGRGIENGLVLKAESYAATNGCDKIYFLESKAQWGDFFKKRSFKLVERGGLLVELASIIDDTKGLVIYSKS